VMEGTYHRLFLVQASAPADFATARHWTFTLSGLVRIRGLPVYAAFAPWKREVPQLLLLLCSVWASPSAFESKGRPGNQLTLEHSRSCCRAAPRPSALQAEGRYASPGLLRLEESCRSWSAAARTPCGEAFRQKLRIT